MTVNFGDLYIRETALLFALKYTFGHTMDEFVSLPIIVTAFEKRRFDSNVSKRWDLWDYKNSLDKLVDFGFLDSNSVQKDSTQDSIPAPEDMSYKFAKPRVIFPEDYRK